MTDLLELAERCEAAEGGDRELGREVLRACGWTQATHGYFIGPLTGWTSPDRSIYFDYYDFVRCKNDPTAFVDAAMTLDCPEIERFGGALAMLREAMDRMHRSGAGKDALPRYLAAAFLRARSSS